MPQLLILTVGELTRDPRARRAALAAVAQGLAVVGLCPRVAGSEPIELTGVSLARAGRVRSRGGLGRKPRGRRRERRLGRELRGLVRLARLARRTVELAA